ncbi:MAG: hypothetical protein ACREQ5_07265 [Candidatus Dormibacteria bacterium]
MRLDVTADDLRPIVHACLAEGIAERDRLGYPEPEAAIRLPEGVLAGARDRPAAHARIRCNLPSLPACAEALSPRLPLYGLSIS